MTTVEFRPSVLSVTWFTVTSLIISASGILALVYQSPGGILANVSYGFMVICGILLGFFGARFVRGRSLRLQSDGFLNCFAGKTPTLIRWDEVSSVRLTGSQNSLRLLVTLESERGILDPACAPHGNSTLIRVTGLDHPPQEILRQFQARIS